MNYVLLTRLKMLYDRATQLANEIEQLRRDVLEAEDDEIITDTGRVEED